MAPRISLALGIHNHQPVGNFGWVFAEVYDQAYRPMIEALERHPGVRMALHYTGPLLDWLRRERPDFAVRLRALVERGQVELMGGGYYEPVLASLPERDRIGQLTRMADEVEGLVGRRPRGAWLAERVWEPDVPTSLVAAGYQWTILDDNHFRSAAIPEENLWGTYTTDDQGSLLTVFGTEFGLRYRIPFGEVEDVIEYLRAHATEDGRRVGMMGDDGEKFGAWPTTYEHCWGSRRWVDRFFTALEENSDWLTTVTPSAWLEMEPPIGRVYVPAASYAEMGEWALPPNETIVFTDLLHRAVAERRPEARYLRGGFWRNFQVKYREVNDLHKQMLRTSAAVAAMPPGPASTVARDHLFQGQSNDCYWHGLFGGIYIAHMRLATYEHLIAAEDAADAAAAAAGASPVAALRDLDLDGIDEAYLPAPGQVVTVKLDEGAGIGGWDIRAPRHALAAVMRRRPEAYHVILRRHEEQLAAGIDVAAPSGGSDGPASIHEIVATKEPGLSTLLHYDDHERRSGLVMLLDPGVSLAEYTSLAFRERGDFVDGGFEVLELGPGVLAVARDGRIETGDGHQPLRIEKRLVLGGGRLDPSLELEVTAIHRGDADVETRLAVAWDLMLLGGGGNPSAWYEAEGLRTAHDGTGQVGPTSLVRQGNDHVGISLATSVEPAADAWWSPIETVSNSESGFERVYQGSSLLLSWVVRMRPGERRSFRVRHQVTATRDRAAEETVGTVDA